MANVETIGKIKGLGTVKVCSANFYNQLNSLKEAGIKYPISVRDTAYMRLNNGPKDGTRTCHAPIYYPKSPVVLAMKTPLLDLEMAKQAVDAHRKNEYFFTQDGSLYEKFHKIAEKDLLDKEPNKRRAVIIPMRETYTLKKGNDISETLFQDTEVEYFDTFAKNGLTFYLINKEIVDSQKGTLVNYLWFGSPGDISDLDGFNGCLCDNLRAFGVSRSRGHAEGVAREKLPYSAREINKNLKILNQVIKGEIKISDLEDKLGNVASFLESLKQ